MTCKHELRLGRGYLAFLAFASLLSACGSDERETLKYRDTGSVCLIPNGEAVTVQVVFDEVCASCEDSVQSCTAELVEGRIQIGSFLERFLGTGPEVCPDACSVRSTTCELPLTQVGSYQVTFGGQSVAAVLPPDSPIRLFGGFNCATAL